MPALQNQITTSSIHDVGDMVLASIIALCQKCPPTPYFIFLPEQIVRCGLRSFPRGSDYNVKEWPGVQEFIDQDLPGIADFENLGSVSRATVDRKRR